LPSAIKESTNVRLSDLLAAMSQELVDGLHADACSVSRVIGDLLILVTEHAPEGRTLILGEGHLASDYPLTQAVLSSGEPSALTASDDDADPAEVRILHALGFASLLLLALPIGGVAWALVEVYRIEPKPFSADDMRVATEILARTSARAG